VPLFTVSIMTSSLVAVTMLHSTLMASAYCSGCCCAQKLQCQLLHKLWPVSVWHVLHLTWKHICSRTCMLIHGRSQLVLRTASVMLLSMSCTHSVAFETLQDTCQSAFIDMSVEHSLMLAVVHLIFAFIYCHNISVCSQVSPHHCCCQLSCQRTPFSLSP